MKHVRGWLASHTGALRGELLLFALALSGLCLTTSCWILNPFSQLPSSHRAVLVDLDGDKDLDAVLTNGVSEGRSESTLWINQGGVQGGQPGVFADSGQRLGSGDYHTMATGDLDGDGDLDILLGSDFPQLEMFINQGGAQGGKIGLFKGAKTFSGDDKWGGLHPIGLGDLDGDGDLDVVTGNCCGGMISYDDGRIQPVPAFNMLWENRTAEESLSQSTKGPAFQSASPPRDEMGGTQAVALGDLDGDGDLDVFLAKKAQIPGLNNEPDSRIFYRVWWNKGDGSFKVGDLGLACPTVLDLALGDLDADGDLDVLAATQNGGQVLFNQGGASGQFVISFGNLGSLYTTSVFLGDVNGDGSLDALLGSADQAQLWINDGRGNFRLDPAVLRYPDRYAVALGDVDGDGDLDVFAALLAERYQVWTNNGNGTFTAAGQ